MRDKHSKLRKISSTNTTWTPKVCGVDLEWGRDTWKTVKYGPKPV